jgi:hypothetical protein
MSGKNRKQYKGVRGRRMQARKGDADLLIQNVLAYEIKARLHNQHPRVVIKIDKAHEDDVYSETRLEMSGFIILLRIQPHKMQISCGEYMAWASRYRTYGLKAFSDPSFNPDQIIGLADGLATMLEEHVQHVRDFKERVHKRCSTSFKYIGTRYD